MASFFVWLVKFGKNIILCCDNKGKTPGLCYF